MKRFVYLATLCFLIVSPGFAQDLFETGELLFEANFDEFVTDPINLSNVQEVGIFDDIPGHDSPALEAFTEGGTENAWSELLQANIDRPENSGDVYWRFQYRVRLENLPYDIQIRMQITEEPWNGFSINQTIPEGAENEWLFFDALANPFAQFSTEQINFSLRFGAQQPQFMQWDDIRIYKSNAIGSVLFESRADERLVKSKGVEWERLNTAGAADGFYIYRTKVDAASSAIDDALVALSRVILIDYAGPFRVTMMVRSDTVPLEIKGGMSDRDDLAGQVVFAQETQTVTEQNKWTPISFLVQALPFSATRVNPFIQFGGKPGAQVDIDRVFTLRTDEEVQNPVSISDWALF